jgi:hypothetical protein
VTYTSKWERLSNAVERIMESTHLSREQAESDICRAISDRAIGVQAKLARHATGLQTSHVTVGGSNLHIPRPLEPHALDWQHSRPINPWLINDLPPHRSGHWHFEWIELLQEDVTREILSPEKAIAPAGSKVPIAAKRKKRATPKLDAAKAALKALYPDGTPPQHVLLNDQLFDKVIKYLEKNNGPHVSRYTVLRAAGPRK